MLSITITCLTVEEETLAAILAGVLLVMVSEGTVVKVFVNADSVVKGTIALGNESFLSFRNVANPGKPYR